MGVEQMAVDEANLPDLNMKPVESEPDRKERVSGLNSFVESSDNSGSGTGAPGPGVLKQEEQYSTALSRGTLKSKKGAQSGEIKATARGVGVVKENNKTYRQRKALKEGIAASIQALKNSGLQEEARPQRKNGSEWSDSELADRRTNRLMKKPGWKHRWPGRKGSHLRRGVSCLLVITIT